MKAQVSTLANGARVVTVPLETARAHAALLLRAGPVFEDDQTWGLSHFLEHMVFRGTKRRKDARAVALAADDFGGEISGATYRDRALFDTRFDPGSELEALGLLGEMVFSPRFEGLDTEREVIREELLEILDDDGKEIDADNVGFARLFDGHPLARSIDGTEDTLDNFDDKLLREFHRRLYRRSSTVVAVAGPVDHGSVVRAAEAALAGVDDGSTEGMRPPRKRSPRKRVHTVRTDASQTQLRLMFRTGGVSDPDRYAISLLARVLDDGPASRLPSRLIDRDGLAYSLWCSTDNYDDAGVLDVGAQVQHERVVDVVKAVARELVEVRDRAPNAKERDRAIARYERDLRDFRDRPGQTAETAARATQLNMKFDPTSWLANLRAQGASDLRRVAQRVLRYDNLTCVLVGLPSRAETAAVDKTLRGALR